MNGSKENIIAQLKRDILPLQGHKPVNAGVMEETGLGPILQAFPQKIFPLGAIHECIADDQESVAATVGFITGISGKIMGAKGITVWISTARKIFPSALAYYNVTADHILFIEIKKEKDLLWATEEALRCEALSCVIAEMPKLDFNSSRRLQLAVEKSCVTGFIIRHLPRQLQSSASICRWKISSLPGHLPDEVPGVGFTRWKVELLKVRNGKTGSWDVQWINGNFHPLYKEAVLFTGEQKQKAG